MFKLSSKFSDPNGLDGNIGNLFKPLGQYVLIIFFIATLLTLLQRKRFNDRAIFRKKLQKQKSIHLQSNENL